MASGPVTPFEKWVQSEDIPVVRGYYVPDVYKVELAPWKRQGGRGAFLILEGGQGFSCSYVAEIPPGGSLKPEKHLFEETIYVLQGQGETRFWNEGGPVRTIAWHEHSLFSPPLNVWHEHINSGNQPAKYVAVTDAPLVFAVYRSPDFVFNTNYNFKDRYDSEPDYFDGVGKMIDGSTWKGGFLPDVRRREMPETEWYGKGLKVLQLRLSGNTMDGHLAQVQVGTYKKPHRHVAAAHLIIVEGTGYGLMWEKWDQRVRADFKKGTIYVPPEGWWHSHFNTGTNVVQQIALRRGYLEVGKQYQARVDLKDGGDLMRRDDEDPVINNLFEEELRKKGLKSAMDTVK